MIATLARRRDAFGAAGLDVFGAVDRNWGSRRVIGIAAARLAERARRGAALLGALGGAMLRALTAPTWCP